MMVQMDNVQNAALGVLRDPLWQSVGVLATVIVATALFRQAQRKKRFEYGIRSTELLSVDQTIRSDIQILYNSQPVQEVRLLAFSFENTGNIPIERIDFDRAIKIEFGSQARILSITIVEKRPSDLDIGIVFPDPPLSPPANYAPTSASLTPMLLNPSDSFQLQCLVTGSAAPHVTARISGIKLKQVSPDGAQRFRANIIGIIAFGLTIGIGYGTVLWGEKIQGLLLLAVGSLWFLVVTAYRRHRMDF